MNNHWEDLKRKPSVKDLKTKLGHLYKTQQEYNRVMARMLDLTKEKI